MKCANVVCTNEAGKNAITLEATITRVRIELTSHLCNECYQDAMAVEHPILELDEQPQYIDKNTMRKL